MPFSMLLHRRTARVLIAVLILSATAAAAVYLARQRLTPAASPGAGSKTGGDAVVAERIQQTSTRDGRMEWSLEAASAQYVLPEKKMVLNELAVTFFTKDGQRLYMTSRYGMVKTESQDMEARDEVVIYNDAYRLETEQIDYAQAVRTITSHTPVRITGRAGEIRADSLSLDLSTNRLVMKGNVRGTLDSENVR